MRDADRLRITEVFLSLQGESRSVGWPTVFVRLTGCPLRCGYCDTAYAFSGGAWWPRQRVLDTVAGYGVRHVTVTGGEPLAQKNVLPLLNALNDAGYEVSLETAGAHDIAPVDPRTVIVMDIKTPGSGEADRFHAPNIEHLKPIDQVKFVLLDRADYDWAVTRLEEYRLPERCEVLFSPAFAQLDPRQLADWIVEDRLPVRFQIQLHKILWGDEPGR